MTLSEITMIVAAVAMPYAAFRMLHGMPLGRVYGGYVPAMLFSFMVTHSPPGTGPNPASLEMTILVLGSAVVMAGVLVFRLLRKVDILVDLLPLQKGARGKVPR